MDQLTENKRSPQSPGTTRKYIYTWILEVADTEHE